jgi:hypothetical protein
MSQNPAFARPALMQNFNGAPRFMQRNIPGNGGPQGVPNGFRDQGFGNHGFNRGGRMPFFSPIFGLIRLVVFGLVITALVWLGYALVKKSGWRLMRTQETASVPSASETADVVGR